MSIVSRDLPEEPDIAIPKREARELLELWRIGDLDAFTRIQNRHPRFRNADKVALATGPFLLADAQLVIAREYSYADWGKLKFRIECNDAMRAMEKAIRHNDRDSAIRLIEANRDLWGANSCSSRNRQLVKTAAMSLPFGRLRHATPSW